MKLQFILYSVIQEGDYYIVEKVVKIDNVTKVIRYYYKDLLQIPFKTEVQEYNCD